MVLLFLPFSDPKQRHEPDNRYNAHLKVTFPNTVLIGHTGVVLQRVNSDTRVHQLAPKRGNKMWYEMTGVENEKKVENEVIFSIKKCHEPPF